MRAAAVEVVRRLQEAGFETYWVGGCVRDRLLGIEPGDYDVATAALPEQAAPLFEASREVGRSFNVLQVRCGDVWIEVATFRSEGDYRDGRHPEHIAPADARTDALRRDFTINALFLDPRTDRVLDFVGGEADLRRGLLRCVGDPAARLHEDALRLLRAVRFACRFALEFEPETRRALEAHAGRLRLVAAERIGEEFLQMLTGPRPERAIALLFETGLLEHFAPELVRLRGCEQSPRHHPEGDVWVHTLRMLALMAASAREQEGDRTLALGILFHDVGKPESRDERGEQVTFYGHERRGQEIAATIMQRLAIPTRTQETVRMLVGQHLRFMDVRQMRKSTLRRFVLQEDFERLLELHRLDALSSRGDLSTWEFCQRELQTITQEGIPVRPLLSGHELQALGYRPGPRLGEILRALVDAQLEGIVRDSPGAQAWVRAQYPPERDR